MIPQGFDPQWLLGPASSLATALLIGWQWLKYINKREEEASAARVAAQTLYKDTIDKLSTEFKNTIDKLVESNERNLQAVLKRGEESERLHESKFQILLKRMLEGKSDIKVSDLGITKQ